jgi:hypothetical protein
MRVNSIEIYHSHFAFFAPLRLGVEQLRLQAVPGGEHAKT